MELSPTQIRFIFSDIKKRGVHLSALQEDILDHICCLVEDEMEQNNDFTKAYLNTLKKFESLKQIQAETTKTIESTGIKAIFFSFLDYFMTCIYLAFGLLFFIMPVFLTLYYWNTSFLLVFSPFVILGLYIILTRINYRRFSIIPFKENVFPNSLVR